MESFQKFKFGRVARCIFQSSNYIQYKLDTIFHNSVFQPCMHPPHRCKTRNETSSVYETTSRFIVAFSQNGNSLESK